MIRKIDHLGIAADSHAAVKDLYEKVLGLRLQSVTDVPTQKVRTAFYPCDNVNLEVLEATSPDGPVRKFLAQRGEGFHHVAFEVDDLRAELARLKSLGVRLVDEAPRPGAHDTLIAFVHPAATHGLLIELVQRRRAR